MDNLWILTEEKPKTSVIKQIINLYKDDFAQKVNFDVEIKIKPIIKDSTFQFKYEVLGIKIENIEKIIIKTVSGSSSFLDFLVFQQEQEPIYNTNEKDDFFHHHAPFRKKTKILSALSFGKSAFRNYKDI